MLIKSSDLNFVLSLLWPDTEPISSGGAQTFGVETMHARRAFARTMEIT